MSSTRGNGLLKRLDRFVGIPLVTALGLTPKRTLPPAASVWRVGLMKTAAIGDSLLLAGFFDDVRRRYTGASVIVVTGQDNASVAGLLPGAADEPVVISPGNPLEAVAAVRAAELDLLVDFGSWPRFDALVAALSGARYTAGFRTAGQLRHFAYDCAVEHSRELHERDNYVRLLRAIGVESTAPPHIDAPRILDTSRYPAAPYAVFHAWPGGYRHETREWSVSRWVALGRELAGRGYAVILSGSPGDAEKTEELRASLGAVGVDATNAAGRYSLAELADLLARSETVVSVNTGVMHLAALVGAPTVGLHGPTSPVRWGPLGPRVRAVTSTLPGCGYLNLGFEYEGQRTDCMDGVSVDAVVAAIDELAGDRSALENRYDPDE
jgi:heptosyltransferase I